MVESPQRTWGQEGCPSCPPRMGSLQGLAVKVPVTSSS